MPRVWARGLCEWVVVCVCEWAKVYSARVVDVVVAVGDGSWESEEEEDC